MTKSAVDSAFIFHLSNELLLTCEGHANRCGTSQGLLPRDSCTAYDDHRGEGTDPNRKRVLCDRCAEDHFEYWDEMWNNYYESQI